MQSKTSTLETRRSLVDRILSAGRTIGVGHCGGLGQIGLRGRLLELRLRLRLWLRVRLSVRGWACDGHTARQLEGEYDDLVHLADSVEVLRQRLILVLMLFGGHEFNVDDHIFIQVLRLSLFN